MKVGIGYSETSESALAGREALAMALKNAGQSTPCSMVLLFCTARHDQEALVKGMRKEIDAEIPVYGGGAVGIITNEMFGYAGSQVGAVCIWIEEEAPHVFIEEGMLQSEFCVGKRLGKHLAQLDTKPDSPVIVFYDAINRTAGKVQLLMADWLLQGIEDELGFLPLLVGAGLQGDHVCSPVNQFAGNRFVDSSALAFKLPSNVHMDVAIMHGCRPASGYYTVTKAQGPVILEINGQRALDFIHGILGPSIPPEQYPFFLIFGINHGEKWQDTGEECYASRLCFNIDKDRGGIVMFEPDMVAGTEFQLMSRTLDPSYMQPRIDALFKNLGGKQPLFALYIDCAGRCAGYGGLDIEDAVVLQNAINKRVPLFGLYTGAEIAPVRGKSRSLDWTGVLCLFSQTEEAQKRQEQSKAQDDTQAAEPIKPKLLQSKTLASDECVTSGINKPFVSSALHNYAANEFTLDEYIPVEAVLKLAEQDVAKIMELDRQIIRTRHELEHKRRSFAVLSEFSGAFQEIHEDVDIFTPVIERINSALNMQKTVVLVANEDKSFTPKYARGYKKDDLEELLGQQIKVSSKFLDPKKPVLVTAKDKPQRYAKLRALLDLPYFISVPIVIRGKIVALLITGRMEEQLPFLSRLSQRDVETLQAVGVSVASMLMYRELERTHEELIVAKDRAEESSRAKSTFLANMSHEIRTPLNAIVGMADIAMHTSDMDRIQYSLHKIDQATNQLLGVINDILDMSKINAGKFSLSNTCFSFKKMMNDVVDIAGVKAKEKQQSLQVVIDKGVPCTIVADEQRLKQVLINLLSNATKFTDQKGMIEVRVHLKETVGTHCVLHFEVEDNGIGIAAEQIPTLFDSFEQADSSISRQYGGTGLGLSISKDIVEMMGGRLWVESKVGEGSNFQFTMQTQKGNCSEEDLAHNPACATQVKLSNSTPEPSKSYENIFTGKRVLLVEDTPLNREIFISLFEETNMYIDCAQNGQIAVDMYLANPHAYDLILMDIHMPVMDGFEATKTIRAAQTPNAQTIPIVAMTANVFKEDVEDCLNAGMNNHIGKPLNKEHVIAVLKKYLL